MDRDAVVVDGGGLVGLAHELASVSEFFEGEM
jgi:hypothetical protein